MRIFQGGEHPVPVIKQGTDGGSIRLDVYFNKSEKVAYAHAEAAALSGLLEYYKVRLL